MSAGQILGYSAFLVLLGAGWGITQPLTKIAVSTGHGHFGLVFWQMVIGAVVMGVICVVRGVGLPRHRSAISLYVILALIGTVLPNTASYQAAVHLPSGILSLLLSMVPMFAFPIALALGNDLFSWRRLFGLICGLLGVLLIIMPGTSLSMDLPVFWILVALIPGLFYAFEGNYVAKWGIGGLNPFQVLWGASVVGSVLMIPVVALSGQFINPAAGLGMAEWALIASSVIHVLVYTGYVWLVGQTGAVFAVQVSYLVTGFGLIWARLILSEAYAPLIWVALAAMFLGMYLVQPRREVALEAPEPIGESKT